MKHAVEQIDENCKYKERIRDNEFQNLFSLLYMGWLRLK